MDAEKLKGILDLHLKFVQGMEEGKRADLCEADLCGANLREADLREADLHRADLCKADLCGANLYGADLYEADLCGANLREANLREANLRGAKLRGANLREADLREADLCRADLYGADLYGADLYEANLREADLCRADLYGADLREANLREANLVFSKFPSIRILSGLSLGNLSASLSVELIRRDAAAHPFPERFQKWANGGECPYQDEEYFWIFNYEQGKALYTPGNPTMTDVELIKAICSEKGWQIRERKSEK